MDKILRIDMGAEGGPRAVEAPAGEYSGMGGRALTSTMVAGEVPPLCHPLGAENKLVIAPGMLSGTSGAMSGRLSVGTKSPLTGGIKEANAGGQAAQVLARLGYAAVVIEGKPKDENLYKVVINKDGVKIIADNSLRMLPNYDLVEKMKAEYGDGIACISIGTAGEMKMCAASIAVTDMEASADPPCGARRGRGGHGGQEGQSDRSGRYWDEDALSQGPREIQGCEQEVCRGASQPSRHGTGAPDLRDKCSDQYHERSGGLSHV